MIIIFSIYVFFLVTRNGLVLSTIRSSKSKTFTDSYVVYKHKNIIKYGVIENIFYVEKQNSYILKIHPLQNTYFDCLTFNGKIFINEYIIYGDMSHNSFDFIYATEVIEKGCFYESEQICYFARFPNLYESS